MPLSIPQRKDLRKSTMIALLTRSPRFHHRTQSAFGSHACSTPLMPSAEDVTAPSIVTDRDGFQNVVGNDELRRARRPASLMVPKSSEVQRLSPLAGNLPKNRDWIRIQRAIQNLFRSRYAPLEPGELAVLHEKVRALSTSKAAPFIYDSYKREIEVCLTSLLQPLRQSDRRCLLSTLSEEWKNIFTHVLPTLDIILYAVKGKGRMTVRQTFLVAFRDTVLTKLDLEELLEEPKGDMPQGIKHMLLIIYNVADTYPPSKSRLKLEGLVARVVSPFLGFLGLYEGDAQPTIKSSEPEHAGRKKSGDGAPVTRKISRPMTTQPRQIETLSELFLTALRKQPDF